MDKGQRFTYAYRSTQLLRLIADYPGCGVGDVAKLSKLTSRQVRRIVTRMQREGLIDVVARYDRAGRPIAQLWVRR